MTMVAADLPQSWLIDTKVALLLNVTDRVDVDRELSTQPPLCFPRVVGGVVLFPAARKFVKVSLGDAIDVPSSPPALLFLFLLLLFLFLLLVDKPAGIRLLPPNLRSSNTSWVPRRDVSLKFLLAAAPKLI